MLLLGFVYFTQERIPYREDIQPEVYIKPTKEAISKVNIEKIWQNDLFNTYQRPPQPIEVVEQIPLPLPPAPQAPAIPAVPKPEFLEPLDITLKGIMILVNDDSRNRAIIANNKLEREGLYKVGDMIEDAQLLRIFNNKVIFIRSNGQQEVLYLREHDAKMDPAYALIGGWNEVIQKVTENNYLLSPTAFSKRITNLAQFIDMLDLTTVYKEGRSIGIRVGQVAQDSLGALLGLLQNDIILTINDIGATDTASRFTLYKIVTAMGEDDIITVTLSRNNQNVSIKYTLRDFKHSEGATPEPVEGEQEVQPPTPKSIELPPEKLEEEQVKVLKEQYKLAPTVKQIRARERSNMVHRGKLPRKKEKFKLTE